MPFGLQLAFQQRMTRVAQNQEHRRAQVFAAFIGQQLHRDAVELFGEARLGELQFQLGQRFHRSQQRVGLLAQTRGHLQQDAMNLRLLVVQEPHQIVVLLNRLQRLDENGLAAGRRSVRHSLHAPPLLDLHGDDEAIAANRDQLFLHGAAFGEPPQITAQRFLDGALLLFDVAANARQLRRSFVVQRTVGKNLVAEVAQQGREVGDVLESSLHRLPTFGDIRRRVKGDLAPLGGAVGHQQQVANLQHFQRGAADARLVDQLGGIEQAVKVEAAARAQVSAQLFRELLLPLNPLPVAPRA